LKPIEVIATGGQNNQLTLNYIHSPEVSGENITLRIVANPKDAHELKISVALNLTVPMLSHSS
ncbi:hypothetical protein IN947_09295, partial [Vibrio cholerae]|nr:hypothetical protein [Vibrio cholerae]